MAKLKLRSAKGSGGQKSKAKAAKGGRRKGKARGGVPYSGQSKGSGGSDSSFDFGANRF